MAKRKVMQFRYYGEKNINNQPNNISKSKLVSGSIFNEYLPIVQLGIQTLPGTKFYLNNGIAPIVIGSTGIYELNLEGLTNITDLSFHAKSLQLIDENISSYLIIDIVYEQEEE